MNNKLKNLSKGFVYLSFIIGSSIIVLIPAKALDNNIIAVKYDVIINPEINNENTMDLYKDKIDLYIREAEEKFNCNDIVGSEESINMALKYIDKISNNIRSQEYIEKTDKILNLINQYKSNEFLKKAVINLGNNNIKESEDYLIKAFNYGNQITESIIRQPIIDMILRIQNQISNCTSR